jgi:hypothetical protein
MASRVSEPIPGSAPLASMSGATGVSANLATPMASATAATPAIAVAAWPGSRLR